MHGAMISGLVTIYGRTYHFAFDFDPRGPDFASLRFPIGTPLMLLTALDTTAGVFPTGWGLLATAAAAPAGGNAAAPAGGGGSSMLLFLGASFFLFYFLVLAPEKRRKAEEEKKRSAVKKNDRVITVGGIHGTVASAAPDDEVVTIKVDGNTRLKVSRSAIAQVVTESDENSKSKPAEGASDG